jgi:hypothetical protein
MDPAAANDALALIARVIKLGRQASNIQYEEAINAARAAILQQKGLNLDLKDENRTLREKLAKSEDYVLDKSVHWKKEDENRDQPFCPVCFAKGREIPLQKTWEGRVKSQSLWSCPDKSCTGLFNPWDYKEPEQTSSGNITSLWPDAY